MDVSTLVRRVQARLRGADLLWGVGAGLAALAGVVAIGTTMLDLRETALAVGIAVATVIVGASAWLSRARWTSLAVAHAVEARVGGLDNLIVTAVSLAHGPTVASPAIRDEIERQAATRARQVSPGLVAPVSRPGLVAAATALGTALILWSVPVRLAVQAPGPAGVPVTSGLGAVRVTVRPPEYLGRETVTLENPESVDVPAGGRMRVDIASDHGYVWLADPLGDARAFDREVGSGAFFDEWSPDKSRVVAISTGDRSGEAIESRLLSINVVPDQAPAVRILTPGRDLAFTTPDQVLDVEIDAADPEALESLELRFVRMSGSGEAFEFNEGRVPLAIERASPTSWRGRARWSLASSSLEDGDSLVYRAVARDSNPDGQPVASESFTIDIGERLEFAGAGFAVPDEDRRYAISQQMVIVKTERLQADREKYSAEDWREDTRGLAVEQRMVRSEVVFLSGGSIEDEVEEAAHSHELQEGRLENAGRAEMLRAMNEMSRAEARLNDGDTVGALEYERLALQALQRAFDRRRYFLRTLPERSRIDPSRRLTGDRSSAASATRPPAAPADDPLVDERTLMQELSRAAESGNTVSSLLAARLASLDGASADWRSLATALTTASTPSDRQRAISEAMAALAARARGRLAPSSARPHAWDDPLAGWFADEIRSGRAKP